MIRFVSFTGDEGLSADAPCFAFFNTCTDSFVNLSGYQVFDDEEDLREAWEDEKGFKHDWNRLVRHVNHWKPVPATPTPTPAERIATTTDAAIDIVLNVNREKS